MVVDAPLKSFNSWIAFDIPQMTLSSVAREGGQRGKLPPLSEDGAFLEASDNVGNFFFLINLRLNYNVNRNIAQNFRRAPRAYSLLTLASQVWPVFRLM